MKGTLLKSTRTKALLVVWSRPRMQMERAAMPTPMLMAGLFRPPPPSTYATPSPSARRLPPTRCATMRIRSNSSIKGEPSSSTTTVKTATTLKMTYLEFNGWLWELYGGCFRVLVDPLLVGNLDFGMPWLFDGAKKTLPGDGLKDLAAVDLLLITSSLDDHCQLRTLTRLAATSPDLPIVATPNARPILAALPFNHVTYLEPGQSTTVVGAMTEIEVTVLATPGPVNGPPWQRPENSYIVTTIRQGQHKHSVYYEPHCMYDAGFLRERGLRADVVITPVVKQQLLATFTLVSGQEDAVELARLLRATYIVPMNNGECDATGLLTAVISTQGTTQAFRDLLADALPQTQVVEPTPGVPLHLHFEDDNNNSSPSSSSS